MADFKKLTDDAATKAAIAAGRDVARRAIDDLLTSDEDKAARDVAKTEGAKGTRWKLVALGVLGLFLFVGLVGMLLNYWYWFLALGVAGVGALYGWWKLRGRLARKKLPPSVVEPANVPSRARVVSKPETDGAAEALALRAKAAEDRRTENEARARAAAEARVVEEQEVDEELAALKARMKK